MGVDMAEPTIDVSELERVARILRREADGKELRKELNRRLKEVIKPAVAEAKASILAFPSAGGPRDGQPLRQSIAAAIKPEVRATGRSAGVKVRVKNRNAPRGFKWAARRLNDERAWRHPVFGDRDVWVAQSSARPRWFDDVMNRDRARYEREVKEVLDDLAQRIAARVNNS